MTTDLETFYSPTFSLTKLATEQYVRSPLFETIGIAIGFDNERPVWYPQPEVADVLASIDWSDKLVLAQNTAFDASILAWHYQVKPLAWLDTLGMSRALFPHEKSHSLKAQAERQGVGIKGDEVLNAIGKGYADFTPQELARYGAYCVNDVVLTKKLFDIYMSMGFPKIELRLIDLTLRMFTEPRLILDKPKLQLHLREVKDAKAQLLDELRDMMLAEGDPDYVHVMFSEGTEGIKKLLMSNEKFAALLRTYGVEPPTKISATTKKEAYAFAKTDEAFIALSEHPDTRVQSLVEARLGNKTTIEETRTERFIGMADRGAFPVPLRYYGAHSGRWSGQDSVNMQNLPSRGANAGRIKKAMMAPEGHVVIDCDSSQIECLSGDTQVLTKERGYVKIVDICKHDLLWDGVAWVAHEGVVYKGDTEVITYAGITGTANHIVYLADGRRVHLLDAANEGAALAVGERGGSAVRFVDGTSRPDTAYQAAASVGTVRALRAEKVGVSPGHAGGKVASLQSVRSNQHVLCVVTGGSSANAKGAVQQDNVLHKPHGYQPLICSVSKAGDGEQVSVLRRFRSICLGMFTASRLYWRGDRAHRQQGPLRTGESAIGVPRSERAEPGMQLGDRVPRGTNERTEVLARGEAILPREHSKLQPKQGEKFGAHIVPVFDIVNAGPRHRFTANGVIVSNCRVLAWLAGQDDLVAAFDRREDVYKIMAGRVYSVDVPDVSYAQRTTGKTVVLGCGYGAGHIKLQLFLKTQAKVEVDAVEAKRIVDAYRNTYNMIPQLWKQGEAALRALAYGQEMTIDKQGLLKVVPGKGIQLPNGLFIQYPDLRRVVDEESGKAAWVYTSKGQPVHIYSGKVVENFSQAVARIIIGEQMLRIAKRYQCVLTVHDAVAIVAKETDADSARAYVEECMNWRPKWAQTLPLACESGMGKSYGDC